MMDELWRSDNLDLKMLSYTCLATGKQVGLIQVVGLICNSFHNLLYILLQLFPLQRTVYEVSN